MIKIEKYKYFMIINSENLDTLRKITTIDLTLDSSYLRKIRDDKNGFFKIEKFTPLNKYITSLETYANVLKVGEILTVQITKKLFSKLPHDATMVFRTTDDITFQRVDNLKSSYSLIDLEFKDYLDFPNCPFVVLKKDGSIYRIEECPEMTMLQLKNKKYIENKEDFDSGIYISIDPNELPEEYQKYIINIESNGDFTYSIKDRKLFLLAASGLQDMLIRTKREYVYLMKQGIPVLVNVNSGVLSIKRYYEGLPKDNYKLYYLLNPSALQYEIESIPPIIINNIYVASLKDNGYVLEPFKKNKKTTQM